MARSLRIEFEGALYHIINRGVGRMTIFHSEKDWMKFLVFQERVIKQFNWTCHAYCLMGNHYLLIETPDPNLSRGMKILNQLYSQFYNWKYQRTGTVFQDRYKAWLVEKEEKFLDNSRYIVNNPVEAKIVQHPSDGPYSSFRATRGLEKPPAYLETDFLLGHFSSSRKKAHNMYEEFVLAGIGMESPLKEAKNQIFIGSDSFIRETMLKVRDPDTLQSLPRGQKMAGRPALNELFNDKVMGSRKKRNNRIKAAFEEYQYPLKEIGEHLKLNPNYLSRLLGDMRKK
ncbi:MAG: transposase [bacterium]|nr:transposase [bacterium]MDT8396164.1 transposase [bacterium]